MPEPNANANFAHTVPATGSEPEVPRREGGRFTYGSGDSPLAGYTIKRGIGVGGFGEVYFALSDGGKEVALKLIRRNLEVELRGAGHCLNLKHPNLLALHDIRRDERDDAWLVMELVHGESLAQTIDRFPQGMPLAEAQHWFAGLAAAVAYLHEHGVVHRDLKPGNIFCDDGVIKLGDYGLAKFLSCSRRSGQTESVGTCHYMAPEIGRGSYGKEIDIYALGVVLYEMLTGRVPFDGECTQEILLKHLTAEPDLATLPEPARSVVARALAKEPSARFPSATAMAQALMGNQVSSAVPPVAASAVGRASQAAAAPQPFLAFHAPTSPGTGNRAFFAQSWANWVFAVAVAIGLIWLARTGAWRTLNTSLGLFLLATVSCLAYFALLWPRRLPPVMATLVDRAREPPLPPPSNHHGRAWHGAQSRERWHERARHMLRNQLPARRAAALLAALLAAAPIAAIMAILMLLLGGQALDAGPATWCLGAWLATTTWLGASAVILPAKLWEGSTGDVVWRRFSLLVTGLALGGFVHLLAGLLLVEWPTTLPLVWDDLFNNRTGAAATGTTAFVGYFAGLLVAPRWWRQADPLRTARLSLWATAGCALWAWLMHMVWPFPQPWGVLLAAGISITAQLAAPLLSATQRSALRAAPGR